MLGLVLGVGRLDGAVDCVQSDQSLLLLLPLPRDHRTSGRGKPWRPCQGWRRWGWLTIDIEPPVTDEVDLVEDGSVRAEEGVECVLRCLAPTPPTDMEHLTPTGGGAVSKVAWKCGQIENSTQNLIVRRGDKLLAICESPLGLIDPCSGPLLVFVRISRKLWCLIFCLSMLIFDLSSTIKKPEPEPALLLVIWFDCERHELVVLESALHYFAEDQLLFVSNFQMISFFLKWNHRWLPFRASWNSFQ